MEIKRGSTANESISLPRESATGHCGRSLQIRRRDVRPAAICKAMLKTSTAQRRPVSQHEAVAEGRTFGAVGKILRFRLTWAVADQRRRLVYRGIVAVNSGRTP
jgi:hypothetical protein